MPPGQQLNPRPLIRTGSVVSRCALVGVPFASILGILAPAAFAGDGPPGYRYGTDTSCPSVTGGPPYRNTFTPSPCPSNTQVNLGGTYGGYLGQYGGWYSIQHCHGGAVNSTDVNAANTNYTTYNAGFGTGEYFFLGGPGRDPSFNPNSYTTSDATAWGDEQGNLAASIWEQTGSILSAYIFGDMELYNGFNNWYSGCSDSIISSTDCCTIQDDQAVINGFLAAIRAASPRGYLRPGIYGSGPYWAATFGCINCSPGSPGYIPNVPEWTYGSTPTPNPPLYPQPYGWTAGQNTAQFFGGQSTSSPYAVMWQWTSGSFSGGLGDYDQINESRMGYS